MMIYPLFPGALFCAVSGKKRKSSLGRVFLSGELLGGAMFAALSFICVRKGADLAFLSKAALFMWGAVLIISIALLAVLKKCREFVRELIKSSKKPGIPGLVIALAFVSVAILYVVRPFPMESGYVTPEQVVTVLDTGALRGFDALSGQAQPAAGNWKDQINNLPLFYACLCQLSGLSPMAVLFNVVPFVVLSAAFCVISLFANAFFEEEKKRATVFAVFALITLCGNSAYMNTSYGLLHYPYEPMTVFSSIVLPLVLGYVLTREHVISFLLVAINGVFLAGVYRGLAVMAISVFAVILAILLVFAVERRGKSWMS
nr:hypothetical protein [Lachnospiraceae bacterium]